MYDRDYRLYCFVTWAINQLGRSARYSHRDYLLVKLTSGENEGERWEALAGLRSKLFCWFDNCSPARGVERAMERMGGEGGFENRLPAALGARLEILC